MTRASFLLCIFWHIVSKTPRDPGQALGGVSHESLHLIQIHSFLVLLSGTGRFPKAKLDGEVELLRFQGAGRKENPLQADLQQFRVIAVSSEDHLE